MLILFLSTSQAVKKYYNLQAQKKYNKKFKIASCKIPLAEFEDIQKHYQGKGFTSVNSYLLDLIKKDMNNKLND